MVLGEQFCQHVLQGTILEARLQTKWVAYTLSVLESPPRREVGH